MSKYQVNGYAVVNAKGSLEPFQFDLPEIGLEQVDVKVEYCGICHSDLSMLDNEWGMPGSYSLGTISPSRVSRSRCSMLRITV